MQSCGNYTAYGTPDVEQLVSSVVDDVVSTVASTMDPRHYRALVLLGGYGRGEGGVEVRDGLAIPDNNFDFLLITQDLRPSQRDACREQLDQAISLIRERRGVGVDLNVVDVDKLQHSQCLVNWYDMRFGHRTLLGDAGFVPSLDQFTVDKIPDWNILDLLVSRGALLVTNDLLLDQAVASESLSRAIVRRLLKATIGYGDAVLYFAGEYDWSDAEKGRRMESCSDAPEQLREMYRQANEFRFQPDYDRFLKRDLRRWTSELREVFSSAHLHCERIRLSQPNLDWRSYFEETFKHSLWSDLRSARAAEKTLNLWCGPRGRVNGSPPSLGGRDTGMQGLLRILFPVVAYELEAPAIRETTASILGAANTSKSELRRGYLRQWGEHSDDNFSDFLGKHGVSLDPEELPA